jgi:DNA-binding CsgD family transcriptional regulator
VVPSSTGTPALVPGEAVLTGAPAARRYYREISAEIRAGAPLLLSVVGVAGAGKTTLLDALVGLCAQVGVAVSRTSDGPPDAVHLIDDAQALAPDAWARLHALAETGAARLVVAHRPWPRPAELGELTALLGKHRSPLLLGDLDRSGVGGRAALLMDGRPPATLVDAVHGQTDGSPALVDRLLTALRDVGALREPGPDGGARSLAAPDQLLERLYAELDTQPEAVRELVLALALGAPPDSEVLVPLLDAREHELPDLFEGAHAAGLLGGSGRPRPVFARAVLRRAPAVRRVTTQRRLAEIQLDRGASVLSCARLLLGSGASGSRVAAVFEAAADEALRYGDPGSGPAERTPNGPALARRFLDAAVQAGSPPSRLAARGAEAAARCGDLDRALELADQVLSGPEVATEDDRARAVTVAAAALAQRGLLARSAELYRWLGAASMGAGAVVAVPALIGAGDLDEARALLEPPAPVPEAGAPTPPPTLLAGTEVLMARGMYDTIVGSPTAALSQLARAAALMEPAGHQVLLPDTPAALAALVAAHCGELDVAQSVLDRAVAAELGGRAAVTRHRLLQAWVAMFRGATQSARGLLARADGRGRLEPRDELVAAALHVGLARRSSDLAALMPAWARAREAIVRHPVDLYVLQPLGELIVASARLREQAWVRPHLLEAHELLRRLGYPVLWSVSLYWAQLHAALQEENWAEAEQQASALERAAESGSRYASAMAVAARCWIAVLHGEVDQAGVESAARGLHAVGLSWDGGKLAGQGAIRTTDRKAMTALLQCARGLQNSGQPDVPPAPREAAPDSEAPPAVPGLETEATRATPVPRSEPAATENEPTGALSDREREVAELVLSGLTYKQIGERLFISAKTVEHHVARMRQRLGSSSRGELIAHLRMIVGQR